MRDHSDELVRQARARGIELWTEGRRLRYRSRTGGVPEALKADLAARRDEITAWLRAEGAERRHLEKMAANQLGMWHQQRLAPESVALNLGFAVRIMGGLELDALSEAVQIVVDRHEALRTDYPELDGSPRRRIVDSHVARIRDEEPLPPGASLAAALRRLVMEPFALEGPPPFRVHRLRQGGDDVLLLVGHHLTLDGLSILLVCKEIVEIYAALRRGEPSPSTAASRTEYTDYVTVQQEWLAGHGHRSAEYWEGVLDPPPPILNLPLDRTRPRIRSLDGGTVSEPCAPGVAEEVRALARSRGTTPFVVLLAAYTTFLRRLTGQSDITVGTPVHGRSSAAVARTIGHLVNVVPIRTRAPYDATFAQVVDSVHRTFNASTPHQEYPFPLMARALGSGAGKADAALPTLFTGAGLRAFSELRDAVPTDGSSPIEEATGLRAEHIRIDQQEGQVDIALEIFDAPGDGYLCSWRYATDVLDEGTVRSWAGVFRALLSGIVASPDRVVSTIPLLAASGGDPRLEGPQRPSGDGLLERIWERAERHGDAIAVESATGSYSYAELVAAVESIGTALSERGVKPGDRVGIMVRRGRELVAGLLGILGTGAAYVPLDPEYPVERRRYMMDDSGAVALLTQRGLDHAVHPTVPVVELGAVDASSRSPPVQADPESPAYVIYTSGSTGRPKGVVIPHAAMTSFLDAMSVEPGLTASDTFLAVTTPSFDISVLELFLPLLVGGRVVIADQKQAAHGEELAELIESAGATVMQATPTTWKLLLSAGWAGKPDLRVLCGGETLSRALADDLLARVREVWNMYGPTETTVWSTADRVEPDGPILIGRPIANTGAYVLDDAMRPLPVGIPGELYIGGAGVAIGYLNSPDLTAERFIEDPFRPGERLYRTGDLVRRRNDGRLEHLGRLDHQVKVRGFRIELGEIESALALHADVEAAVVTADTSEVDAARLVAWVEPRRGRPVAPDELRALLGTRLPPYMLPTSWSVVDSLPRTPNGKLDRRALDDRLRFETRSASARRSSPPMVAPRNAEESILAEIWLEVLDVDEIGIHDDFFQLGGHSLLATMVAARVRAVFGVDLPLRRLFEQPTIAATADWIRDPQDRPVAVHPLRPRRGDGTAPLSFSQERMWFLQELVPEDTSYNLALATLVRGPFDPATVVEALTELERRHTVLRSRIRAERGRASQVVTETGGFERFETDFTHLTGRDARERAIDFASAAVNRPYDLADDAPMRLVVARVADEEWLVALGLHHVVADQGSFDLLIRELSELYDRRSEADLRALPVQYADFAVWQRELFRMEKLAPDLAYWIDQLDGVPQLDVAADHPRPRFSARTGDRILSKIPPETLRGIRELSLELRVTPFMLLLAVFDVLLYARARQADVPVGVPIAHRTHRELEGLIGTFVNTLVHRNDLSGDPTFRELVARVRDTSLAAFSHQDVPFELLVRELQPERDTSRSPLFQAMFNLALHRTGEVRLPSLETEPIVLPTRAAQFDLTMSVMIDDRNQWYALNYRTDLFAPSTAESMLRQYAEIVERVVADPEARLGELAAAPRGERWLVLDEWNRTRVDHSDRRGLVQRVLERVERDGNRVAVASASGCYTYRELAEAAAAVSAQLRSMGVERGDRVAVLLRRDRGLLAGLLGVLGSGAAYVPMDPEYPPTRLVYMLQDCGAVALVTRGDLTAGLDIAVPVVDLDVHQQPDAAPPDPADATRSVAAALRERFTHTSERDTAYVIYTSGSTGEPKGVCVPHGALMNFLRAMEEEPGLSETDTLLAVTTASFDIAVLELCLPLLVGGRVVIASEDETLDGRRLAERIEREDVTVMQATPATWKLLLSAGWKGKRDLRILCGGESLPPELAHDLAERSAAVWNMYGPTETTVWSTVHRIRKGAPVLIGRPIANTTLYVLDDDMRPLPIGVPGELYIGGAGVASGYLNRPELTAERFVDNPFGDGGRLYRTGDLVRYRRDGCMEHLGRLDHQLKVRGFRVEPGEVEAALRRHEGVRDAVVVARSERLVAYVVPVAEPPPSALDLRRWLAERLPRHMVPSLVRTIESVPLTPNGKVDRIRLPDSANSPHLERESLPLTTDAEHQIAEVWRTLLGVQQIGAGDNFFELGGHSLLAMEVVALLEERTGVRLDPRELFFKSVRQLGRILSASR